MHSSADDSSSDSLPVGASERMRCINTSRMSTRAEREGEAVAFKMFSAPTVRIVTMSSRMSVSGADTLKASVKRRKAGLRKFCCACSSSSDSGMVVRGRKKRLMTSVAGKNGLIFINKAPIWSVLYDFLSRLVDLRETRWTDDGLA